MAKRSFKAGDIVQLKSGGPPMTVSEVDDTFEETVVRCQWFAGKKMLSGDFSPKALEPAPKP